VRQDERGARPLFLYLRPAGQDSSCGRILPLHRRPHHKMHKTRLPKSQENPPPACEESIHGELVKSW